MAKIYQLEFKLPGEDTEKIVVLEKLAVGSGSEMDVTIVDAGLAKKQFIFRYQNKILTVQVSGDADTYLQSKKLARGKVFILELDDILTCGELEIKVLLFAGLQEERTFAGTNTTSRRISISQSIISQEIPHSLGEESEEKEADDESLLNSDFNIIAPQITNKPVEADSTAPTLESPVAKSKQKSTSKTLTNLVIGLRSFLSPEEKKTNPNEITAIDSVDLPKAMNNAKLSNASPASPPGKLALNLSAKKPNLPKISHKAPLLSPWARIYGISFMATLTYGTYHFLIPLLGLDRHLITIEKLVHRYVPVNFLQHVPFPLPFNEQHLWKLLPYILTYAVLETMAHLLFARSLVHVLFGAQVRGNFLLLRILGPLRCWLGIITGPFLIGDFPLLLGKPGLKEILTATRIERGTSPLKAIIGKLLLAPLIMLAILVLPLFSLNLPDLVLEDFNIPFDNRTGRKIAGSKDDKKVAQSNEMLQIQISLANEMIGNILPFITFDPNHGMPKGGMKIWADKDFISLTMLGQVSIKNIALKMKAGNPFLGDFYPRLDHYLSSGKLSPTAPDELQKLLIGIFSLQWSNLHHFFLNNGPFSFGPIMIKNELLSNFSIKKYKRSALEIIGNRNFVVIYPPDTDTKKFLLGQNGEQLRLYQLTSNRPNFELPATLQTILDSIKWDTTLDLASTEKLAETTLLELEKTTPWSAFEIQNALYLIHKWPNLKKTFVIEKTYNFFLQQTTLMENFPQRKKDLRTSLFNVISALSRLNFSAANIEKLTKLMEGIDHSAGK